MQTPLWLGIEPADEPKTLRIAVGRHALADDDFKPTFSSLPVSRMHVTSIDPNDQRAGRFG
jgi:hypothetical protein